MSFFLSRIFSTSYSFSFFDLNDHFLINDVLTNALSSSSLWNTEWIFFFMITWCDKLLILTCSLSRMISSWHDKVFYFLQSSCFWYLNKLCLLWRCRDFFFFVFFLFLILLIKNLRFFGKSFCNWWIFVITRFAFWLIVLNVFVEMFMWDSWFAKCEDIFVAFDVMLL